MPFRYPGCAISPPGLAFNINGKTMRNKKKIKSYKLFAGESGQALVLTLVFLVLGSLVLTPLLSYLGTVFQAGGVYRDKTDKLYAADSGIEDAMWQIKYDRLESLFTTPPYDQYNYSTIWSYELDDTINEHSATVTIQNLWMIRDVAPLDPVDAREIIEASKLMVTGNAPGDTTYDIKISFYPDEEEAEALLVESIGIWMPLGFTYVPNSSTLEEDPFEEYYSVPEVEPYDGGNTIIWEFESVPLASFPGVNPLASPMLTEISFQYTSSQPDVKPAAIAWMTTTGVADVPIAWDADFSVFHITSESDDTQIEAHTVKCELRKLGSAIAGDYRAVGNSLMIDSNHDPWEIRDELLDESEAEITDIPPDAEVVAAYLYWSGFFADSLYDPIFEDDCNGFGDWSNPASVWTISSHSFSGRAHSSPPDWHRYLTLKNPLDLSPYIGQTVTLSWDHWEWGDLESTDALQFQFSDDDGETWGDLYTAFSGDIGHWPQDYSCEIPGQYLTDEFLMRFYLDGFGGSDEYCYIDNIVIESIALNADTTAIFKINGNQVYLDEFGEPQTGEQEIVASQWSTLENNPGQYSYACQLDVTDLVQEYSNIGANENHTGNGEYIVGDVDADTDEHWSYAGWSIIIIYSSPATAGHQLYLYDDFIWAQVSSNFDWDDDGEPGGTITGFIVPEPIGGEVNAASLTCFVAEGDDWRNGDQLVFNDTALSDGFDPNDVWNSQSVGMTEDGMDIDTFDITWASNLLEPGDTTVQLDMPNPGDNWNLIYIILSLRSKTSIGGTSHYVVRGS